MPTPTPSNAGISFRATEVEKLPIFSHLDEVKREFLNGNLMVLTATPGSGKTTLVPPFLLNSVSGKILLVEPRRVAARAAIQRIADVIGASVGGVVGYAVRDESRVSKETRLLAVTPGVFRAMLREDPALEGVSAVIFDEFHERSAEVDLGFSLALDSQKVLRDDLKLMLMSATLNTEELRSKLPVARFVDVPGREYPVQVEYSDSTPSLRDLASAAFQAILRELKGSSRGHILVFLPGIREINACCNALVAENLPEIAVYPLHGGMTLAAQTMAMVPTSGATRKVIVATNVAESSITVDGITVVIDSGWERFLRYDAGAGLPYLEYRRVSLASATQRAGRAGRTAPGKALRLWHFADNTGRPPTSPPEILSCDLAEIALELAAWGNPDGTGLFVFDAPPAPTLAVARRLLADLGALTADGKRLSELGEKLLKLPTHPRLGAMLLAAFRQGSLTTAAAIAAVLEERNHGVEVDLRRVLDNFHRHGKESALARSFRRFLALFPERRNALIDSAQSGALVAVAFPEWVAARTAAGGGVYRLMGGGGARIDDLDSELCHCEFLAVASLAGTSGRNSRILLAAPLAEADLRRIFSTQITRQNVVETDDKTGRVRAFALEKVGEITLTRHEIPLPPELAALPIMENALRRQIVLPPTKSAAACRLLARLRFAAARGEVAECWREENHRELLTSKIVPFLPPIQDTDDLEKCDWLTLLSCVLARDDRKALDKFYPDFFTAPSGRRFPINYDGEMPTVSARVQEFYGLDTQPCVGEKALPLRLELLSPANRPVQLTADLPGFWRGSWALVRKEMRGRYPKHNWPEHPETESPSRR